MMVLGIDPGATVGWALLRFDGDAMHGRRVQFVDGGSEPGCAQSLADFINADLVALEDVAGYAYGKDNYKRTKALIDAAKIGERIATIAEHVWCKRVVRMTAAKARLAILGKSNASDAAIKVAVQRIVRGLPTRTNAHERDAMVVAMAVGLSTVWTTTAKQEART